MTLQGITSSSVCCHTDKHTHSLTKDTSDGSKAEQQRAQRRRLALAVFVSIKMEFKDSDENESTYSLLALTLRGLHVHI